MELLQNKYLRAERAVWELEEPAILSERERKTRFSENSRNAHHYCVVYKFLVSLRRVSCAVGSKIASRTRAKEGGTLSAVGNSSEPTPGKSGNITFCAASRTTQTLQTAGLTLSMSPLPQSRSALLKFPVVCRTDPHSEPLSPYTRLSG